MAHPSVFSESCEHDVHAAIARACHEALSIAQDESRFLAPYMTIHDVAGEVLALVQRSITAFAAAQNDRSALMRMLPSEILCDIFMRLPLSDCIRATHVCRKLRDILLNGSGMLWSHELSFSSPPGMLSALLERSSSSAIELTGKLAPENWAEIALCLERHLDRCTLLGIDLDVVLPVDGQLAITRALCGSPAPRLHTLRIQDPYCQFNVSLDANNQLFTGVAPNLTLAKIFADMRAISPNISFPSVRWLIFLSPRQPASMRDVRTVYERFPGLEEVSMELSEWEDDNEAPPTLPQGSTFNIIIHRIRHITDAQVAAVVSRLEVGNAGRNMDFLVSYNVAESNRADTIPAHTSWIPPAGFACVALVMFDPLLSPDLHTTIFLDRIALLTRDPASARLVIFSIPESVIALDILWPEMPVLEVLSISLSSPFGARADEAGSIFLLPRGRPRLTCPALRKVHIVAPPPQHPRVRMYSMHLDPALLSEFIEEQVSISTEHPPCLVLRNARLLENRADDVARLLARVKTLQVAPDDHAIVLADPKGTFTPETSNLAYSFFLIRDWT